MERYYFHYYTGQYLEIRDLVYTPLFIALIYFLANTFKERLIGHNSSLQRYFIPALTVKMGGALAAGLVYQYYYGGGDTMDFYTSGSYVTNLFFDKPLDAIQLLSANPVLDNYEFAKYDFLLFIYDPPSWTMVRTIAVVGLFGFDSYPVISLFFSLFSLYCSWKFFTLLSDIYQDPKLTRKFAYCIFYIPSVFFWGSSVFKDSLTLGGLLLFTYHIYQIMIRRKFNPSQFIWLGIGLYLMVSIRLFFLVILIPCLGFWFFAEFRDKLIKNNLLRTVSFPFLLLLSMTIIIFGMNRVLNDPTAGELSAKTLQEKAEGFQTYHGSLGGSSYSLGDIDYTPVGLLKVFPLAVNVTLFRPYVFEAHSAFQIIDALQSLFFLYYFLRTISRTRLSFFTSITQDSMILFSLTFSIFYSFVAGFTSYNFGALDRYKIPALPFFMIALVLVNYRYEQNKKKKPIQVPA